MNYTKSVLSAPYPHDYFDLGKQAIIEWKINDQNNSVNKGFLRHLKTQGKLTQKLFSTIDESGKFFEKHSFLPPKLFIFHVSRCGSSYASHYFASNPENRVFYEPYFLIQFNRKHWDSTPENTVKLKHVIQLLGCGGMPEQKRLIIKTTSNFIQKFKEVHSIFPDVPKVLIYRDPKEVLASLFETPPIYLPEKKDGEKELLLASIEHLKTIFRHAVDNKTNFLTCINYSNLKEQIKNLEIQLRYDNNSSYRLEQLKLIETRNSKNIKEDFFPDTKEKQKIWQKLQDKYQLPIDTLEKQFEILKETSLA